MSCSLAIANDTSMLTGPILFRVYWFMGVPGVYFISGLFSLMLYGMTCGQMTYYCYHYLRGDRVPLKWLVVFIWALDTVATVSDAYMMWATIPMQSTLQYGIQSGVEWSSFADPPAPPLYYVEYAAVTVIAFIVQIFYIHCIWQLLKSARSSRCRILAITVLPAILSLGSLFCSSVTMYNLEETHDPETDPGAIWTTTGAIILSVGAGIAVVVDIYISVILSWSLRKMKTGFKHTDRVLQRLTVYVINRGLLTAAAQTAILMTFVVAQNSSWLIIHCIGGKLYVNSMMAVLNDRQHLKEKYAASSGMELKTFKDASGAQFTP